MVLSFEGGGCPFDPVSDEGQVVGVAFDADGVEAFEDGGFDGGPGSCEGVEDGPVGWGDHADQPAHEGERLHGPSSRVGNTPTRLRHHLLEVVADVRRDFIWSQVTHRESLPKG